MTDWFLYFEKISNNPEEKARLRNYLTINVTEFFRDTQHWKTLEEKVLPLLISQAEARKSNIKIWSAGCSIGVEAYTVVIALEEAVPRVHYEIFASDVDRGVLQKAKGRGPYVGEEIRNLSPMLKEKYLDKAEEKYYFKEKYTHSIRFFEQDLLLDKFTGGFDLIVCRNVVIYFTSEAKNMLYQKFWHALRPGGVLFVGGTELLPRPSEYNFVSNWTSFYTKVQTCSSPAVVSKEEVKA